jgi:sugar-specific transcriptional regulator TrmB
MNEINEKLDYTETLRKAGLTEAQAKAYLYLVNNGRTSPVKLANGIGETRTNGYKIADRLVELNLAEKIDDDKITYIPLHPTEVEALAEKRRKVVQKNELSVKSNINGLIDLFYANSETPGTRNYSGVEGIKTVYEDVLRTSKPVYIINTVANEGLLGSEYFKKYRLRRAKKGIESYALTPETTRARLHKNVGEHKRLLWYSTFYPQNAYLAPVEIDIYGNKIALIAFGETQMATVIESPLIAEAMRQIHTLLTNLLVDAARRGF